MVDKSDLSFRSVVFGTDFSDGARAGGRYAALFARHYHADLIVAHAFTLVQPALEVEALQHVRSQQRKDLEKRLSETVNSLAPVARGATGILGEGTPMHVIGEMSARNSPCLIVLGTHGGSALERRIIGSVAEEILRTVWRPVLTVGPHVALPNPGGPLISPNPVRDGFFSSCRRCGSLRSGPGGSLQQRNRRDARGFTRGDGRIGRSLERTRGGVSQRPAPTRS